MTVNLEIVEFKDPEKNALAEVKYYEFLDWLNASRRKAENAVRDMYPHLKDGISVQAIKKALGEAAYWRNIPDEMAGAFAYDVVVRGEAHLKVLAEALDITVYEFWLDSHYMPDEPDDVNDV